MKTYKSKNTLKKYSVDRIHAALAGAQSAMFALKAVSVECLLQIGEETVTIGGQANIYPVNAFVAIGSYDNLWATAFTLRRADYSNRSKLKRGGVIQ